MHLPHLLFPLSALLFLGYLVYAARHASAEPRPGRWKLPAGLAIVFLLFSAGTVLSEGPLGVLVEHTRTLWSSQIWMDLLLGVSIALWWMLPRARALGMHLAPWLVLVVVGGNIGLLAMLSRIWWLQEQRQPD